MSSLPVRLKIAVALMLIVSALVGTGPFTGMPTAQAGPQPQTALGRVRFVHVAQDVPGLDAYIDGRLWVAGLLTESNYSDVTPGEHTFTFRLSGRPDDLTSTTYTVEAGQRVTIAALNTLDSLEALAITDDVSATARNAARIKVIHALPGGAPVDVALDEVALAEGLAYGEISDATQVIAGSYDLAIAEAEDKSPLFNEVGRGFTGDRSYTLFVTAGAEPGRLRIQAVSSNVLVPTASSQFRFVNAAQRTGQVTVYVNRTSEPLYPEVPFSRVTNYLATGPGPHLFEVYPFGKGPGDGPPLAAAQAEIGAGESVLFAAYGSPDDMALAVFRGSLLPVPPNSARLQVVHVASGNPAVQVSLMDSGTVLFDRVSLNNAVVRSIAAGTYDIHLTDAETGETMMERRGIPVPPGTLTLLIVFDDDPAAPLVNAVPVSVDGVPQYAWVRWAHLNIWGPRADIYLGDQLMAASLAYQSVTDYRLVPPGRYLLRAFPAGANPKTTVALDEREVVLGGSGAGRTVFLHGEPDRVRFELSVDSLELIPAERARIRFVNAALDTGAVDVVNPVDESRWMEAMYYQQSSVNINVTPGEYGFEFRRGTSTLARLDDLVIRPGIAYTVILTGANGLPDGLDVIVLQAEP